MFNFNNPNNNPFDLSKTENVLRLVVYKKLCENARKMKAEEAKAKEKAKGNKDEANEDDTFEF